MDGTMCFCWLDAGWTELELQDLPVNLHQAPLAEQGVINVCVENVHISPVSLW